MYNLIFIFSNPGLSWAWWEKNQFLNRIFGSGLESGGGPGQKLGQFRPDPAQKPIKTMQNEDPKETTNWNTVLAVSTFLFTPTLAGGLSEDHRP